MATSKSFEADLPELTAKQLTKLYTWGQTPCEPFDIRMNPDMSMTVYATRTKSDIARGHQRLLRTNLVNWGVSLPNKQNGWLRLTSPEIVAANDDQQNKASPQATNTVQQDVVQRGEFLLSMPENLLRVPILSQ